MRSAVEWGGARFEPPEGLVDTSVLSFREDAAEPRFSLTIARDHVPGGADGLPDYARAQLRVLAEALGAEVRLEHEVHRGVAGRDVLQLDVELRLGDGGLRAQRVVYVPLDEATLILTLSYHPVAAAPARRRLEALLAGLRVFVAGR
jgi:hypothetical protein